MDRISGFGQGDESAGEGLKKRRIALRVSPLFPLPILCFLLSGAGELLPAGLLAALLHELGHVAAIYLVGGRVTSVSLEPFGGEIATGGTVRSYIGELTVSLAGPTVNFLCALPLFFNASPGFFSYFALCSLGLGIFNLLPVKALDGGEILQTLLLLRLDPDLSDKICRAVSFAFALLFCIFALYGLLFWRINPTLVLLSFYLLFSLL